MAKDRDETATSPVGGDTVQIDVSRIDAGVDSPKKTAFLTLIRGSDQDLGRHVLLGDTSVRLGRSQDVEFPMQDHGVSRSHARIEPGEEGYVVRDLGSTNGTRVNGDALLDPRLLRDGDKLFMGETVLRFALADDLDLGFQLEVAQLVGQDPLTGLESKRIFDAALEFAVQNAMQESAPLALLMMDMDGVKYINDTHGHLFGAHVIGETGRILREGVDGIGRVCRFGGDEFCAFLPGCAKEDAVAPAEVIRQALENAGLEMEGIQLRPTLSIGIAAFPADASNPRALLSAADAALYRAKAAGKNCVAT
jgi:two-component system cell cycle response regulator